MEYDTNKMKQKKRTTLVVFSVIFLLLIVGCDKANQETLVGDSPYAGGTKGLVAEFEEMGFFNEESGMEEIFWDETFPIEVVLKNKGEEAIPVDGVKVTLLGLNLGDFENIGSSGSLLNREIIEEVSEFNEEGGEIMLDFTSGTNDANYTIVFPGTSYDISIFANIEYDYQTHSSVPKVCFKGNLKDPSVCKVDETKDVFSSAAPIQVKSVEEKRAGTGKVALEFQIENVGAGKVTKKGEAFDPRFDRLSYTISDTDNWDCRTGGRANEARLDEEGKATVICRWKGTPLTEDDIYTKQVDLTLNYKYKEIIQKQIRIKST
tara:strand:- start:943 stop:1902 length:960 start_codon:yes stop_codon:yes gene_type:complete